jgi:hypothetical protein
MDITGEKGERRSSVFIKLSGIIIITPAGMERSRKNKMKKTEPIHILPFDHTA